IQFTMLFSLIIISLIVDSTIAGPATENPNCVKWASDPATAFCVSDKITLQQKQTFCVNTCSFEISPTADCAIYTVASNKFSLQTTRQRSLNIDPLVRGITVSRVYVGSTCTLALYTMPTPDPATDFPAETKVGSTGNFQMVTTTNAASFKCSCT
ncbi:hypothetical protein PENTCL1PPCAC_3939, partial [Pristionchus entomophagus]